jgi:hypothetical protein
MFYGSKHGGVKIKNKVIPTNFLGNKVVRTS